MKVEDFEDDELQKMRFLISRPDRLARYFEGDEKGNARYIENVTKPPVSYVKSLDFTVLSYLILKRGYRRLAECFGVSESFLRNEVSFKIKGSSTDKYDLFEPCSEAKLISYVEKIKFSSLLKVITGWTLTKIKKKVGIPRLNVESNLTMSKGRRAELWFKEHRGDSIVKDMNLEDNAKCPYDFQDAFLGRVDVKSAKSVMTKTRGYRWYFNLKPNEKGLFDCDYFALVGYDSLFELPLFLKYIQPKDLIKSAIVVAEDSEVDVRITQV